VTPPDHTGDPPSYNTLFEVIFWPKMFGKKFSPKNHCLAKKHFYVKKYFLSKKKTFLRKKIFFGRKKTFLCEK